MHLDKVFVSRLMNQSGTIMPIRHLRTVQDIKVRDWLILPIHQEIKHLRFTRFIRFLLKVMVKILTVAVVETVNTQEVAEVQIMVQVE